MTFPSVCAWTPAGSECCCPCVLDLLVFTQIPAFRMPCGLLGPISSCSNLTLSRCWITARFTEPPVDHGIGSSFRAAELQPLVYLTALPSGESWLNHNRVTRSPPRHPDSRDCSALAPWFRRWGNGRPAPFWLILCPALARRSCPAATARGNPSSLTQTPRQHRGALVALLLPHLFQHRGCWPPG